MVLPVSAPITQAFGANATANLPPTDPIIQAYGNYQPGGHTGTDFGVPEGTPVKAVADGKILHSDWAATLPGDDTYNGWASRWFLDHQFGGYLIVIQHAGYKTVSAHLSYSDTNAGDVVVAGQVIGYSGTTGLSTGPHLHFEVIPDPPDYGNTVYGRVDPIKYLTKNTGGAMPFNLDGMADALRKYGIPVIEEPGWKTRGYAAQDLIRYGGVLWHHTASNRGSYPSNSWPSGWILRDGRSDLPGPLCNLSIDRNGVVRVVATGVANHAGTGYAMGIVPKDMGNHYFIGIEIESSGIAPCDLTETMKRTIITVGAVLEVTYGGALNPADRLQPLHLEYSDAGKIDLFGWPGGGDGLRASINDTINQISKGGTLPSTPTPAPKPATKKDWLDMATQAEVRQIIREEVGKAVWNYPILNRQLKRNENAETILGSNEDRIIRQQLTPLRQTADLARSEAANAKTYALDAKTRATAIEDAVTKLGAVGGDPAAVTAAVTQAIDTALSGLVITRKES